MTNSSVCYSLTSLSPLHVGGPLRCFLPPVSMNTVQALRSSCRRLVLSIVDAYEVVEGCLHRRLCRVPRGPYPEEWRDVARARKYEEYYSGMTVWLDRIEWSVVQASPGFVIEKSPISPPGWCPNMLPYDLIRISIDIVVQGTKHSVVSYQNGCLLDARGGYCLDGRQHFRLARFQGQGREIT